MLGKTDIGHYLLFIHKKLEQRRNPINTQLSSFLNTKIVASTTRAETEKARLVTNVKSEKLPGADLLPLDSIRQSKMVSQTKTEPAFP